MFRAKQIELPARVIWPTTRKILPPTLSLSSKAQDAHDQNQCYSSIYRVVHWRKRDDTCRQRSALLVLGALFFIYLFGSIHHFHIILLTLVDKTTVARREDVNKTVLMVTG